MNERTDTALEAMGLEKSFSGNCAVDSVSFSVPRRCVFGFLGPNGAGKTTVLRLLLGLLRPDAGMARVLGLDTVACAREIRLRTGYVSQMHSLYGDLSVDENLRFFGSMYGLSGDDLNRRMHEERERFRLNERDRPAAGLGTGAQRRLALACALLHRPELLILDEPTSGMDSLGRRDFWKFVGGLTADDVSIVITTHHLDEAENCDELGLMQNGRFGFQGTPAELKSRYGGSVLAVTCDPWETGFNALHSAFDASLFGTRSHVDGRMASPADVEAVLRREGVRLVGLEEKPPSMEDAFLRATAEEGSRG